MILQCKMLILRYAHTITSWAYIRWQQSWLCQEKDQPQIGKYMWLKPHKINRSDIGVLEWSITEEAQKLEIRKPSNFPN